MGGRSWAGPTHAPGGSVTCRVSVIIAKPRGQLRFIASYVPRLGSRYIVTASSDGAVASTSGVLGPLTAAAGAGSGRAAP